MPRNPLTIRPIAILPVLIVSLSMAGCGGQPTIEPKSPQTVRTKSEPKSSEPARKPSEFLPPSKKDRHRPDVLPIFANVAVTSGIRFTFFSDIVPNRYFLPEIMGGGAGWCDFDGDGLYDLYVMDGCPLQNADPARTDYGNRMFRNLGNGQFEDVSQQSAAADRHYGQGVAAGDFDADGFVDLYLANYGANVLLHNNGDGTFSDATEVAGTGDPLWSTSPIWLDLDFDGDLDLYVTNYLLVTFENTQVCAYDGVPGYCGPGSYEAASDRVFVNQGDGRFIESAEPLGLIAEGGKGLAIAALDFDNDLRPEIYVANDMMENFLFSYARHDEAATDPRNGTQEGDLSPSPPRYVNMAAKAGCAVSLTGIHEASMGVACADFDGDQLADIFVTHYFANKNTLYHNLGELTFHDDSRRTRIAATSYETLGFGTVPLDYNQDGAMDLFITNGHVLGPLHKPNEMPPQLLHNDGRGSFAEVSQFGGPYFDKLWLGRGAAGGDYDNDGDLDLVVTHIDQPVALLRNDTETNHHWLGLELVTNSRMQPVGGRVVLRYGGRQMTQAVVAGGSYLSSADPRMLFGLAEHAGTVDVEVHWPSGKIGVHPKLEVDRYWRLAEPTNIKPTQADD